MPLTQDEVVAEAVALLDEVGLEGLTLRRLAARLGVSAPTLYWHVDDKRTLLDLMAERIVAEVDPDGMDAPLPGQPWWAWIADRSRALFAALVAHRDAPLVVAGNRPSPESLERTEAMLATLVDRSGMSPADAMTVIFSLGQYVIGSAIEWQSEARRTEDQRGASSVSAAAMRIGAGPETFPMLRSAILGMSGRRHSAAFDTGLDLFVDGLRARFGDQVEA